MAFTRSGVRSPSPPSKSWWAGPLSHYICNARGNSSVGRAQPCQGWGRGFESRFPLSKRQRSDHNDAGWSSLVARRAHNPEVVGSNPTPAITNAERGTRNAEQVPQDSLFRVTP